MLIRRDDGYEISDDPERLNLNLIHTWLSTDAYWALGRTRDVMDRSVAGSTNFGLYDRQGEQLAFARIVSDRATFAWLCDVYVERGARGHGLGTWFVNAVCEEVRSWGLRRLILATMDAHGLYEKIGFTAMSQPERWMECRLAP